jgi:hypothetical protein
MANNNRVTLESLAAELEALKAENAALKAQSQSGGRKIIVKAGTKTEGIIWLILQGFPGVSPRPVALNPVGMAMTFSKPVVEAVRAHLLKNGYTTENGEPTEKARAVVAKLAADRAAKMGVNVEA